MFTDLYEDIYGYDYGADPDSRLDVPFVPTGERIVAAMLKLAEVGEDDLLYDLGCGDGRIVVAAAKDYGARAVGIDMNPHRLIEAREYAEWTGVGPQVAFIEDDLLCADFSKATVVTLYLLPTINMELRPRLLSELQPGTRIVSHAFDMGNWRADKHITVEGANLYLWIVPAAVAGTWQWRTRDGSQYRVELAQRFQQVQGRAWIDDKPALLQSAKLRGACLQLVIQPDEAAPAQVFVSRYRDGQLLPGAGSMQASAGVKIA